MKKIKVLNVYVWIFGVATMLLGIFSILHPRFQNIVTALFMVLMTAMCIYWKNKGKQQDKVPSGGKILIAALLGSCMIYYVGAFFAPLFPRHMLYEYKSDIKKLKEEYREAYFFFLDAIPEEATDVTWVVCPSMMQGSGYEFLGFKASEEYINSIVAKYKEEAHVRNRSEESYDKKVFDNYLGEFSETAVDYELYNNNDWNHERMRGILVSKENRYIGFYCQ